MRLSEKIQLLRKRKGLSQEDLASICNVSRQSISKWEADIALPETEKLILLSHNFNVSVDVLLKDELSIGGIEKVHSCGRNAVQKRKESIFEGAVIKESLEDDTILAFLCIHKVELWDTGGNPRFWTVIYFTCSQHNFPELISKALIADEERGGNWFADFKKENNKYIVFKNKILVYEIGNYDEKSKVCEECRKLGIPDEQMQWKE